MASADFSETAGIDNREIKLEKLQDEEVDDLEWTVDQEIFLLYSLHGCKPVGPSKHFRMLLIKDRLSNALNKNISTKAIWKKLNTLYDLEALDEAEAEADAAVAVDTDFSLPEDEYGELMREKLKGTKTKICDNSGAENSDSQEGETLAEIKQELESCDDNETDTEVGSTIRGGKEGKKEPPKRGLKKKDTALVKDATPIKKEILSPKKDTPTKKDAGKEAKRGSLKESEKKSSQDIKKDLSKEQKEKETASKPGKRESADKKLSERIKKETDVTKPEQKKITETSKNQRETTKPVAEKPKLRLETKRTEAKITRSETPKPQRVEALKKDSSLEKKKETSDKKLESKSPEKITDSVRTPKLRTRDKKETEPDVTTGTKRERSRDSTSKATETPNDEPQAKKVKTPIAKGRPTRNSESTPTNSPQKRRTRI